MNQMIKKCRWKNTKEEGWKEFTVFLYDCIPAETVPTEASSPSPTLITMV